MVHILKKSYKKFLCVDSNFIFICTQSQKKNSQKKSIATELHPAPSIQTYAKVFRRIMRGI